MGETGPEGRSGASGLAVTVGDADGETFSARSASVGDISAGVGIDDEGSGACGGGASGSVTVACCGGTAAATFSCIGATAGAAASLTGLDSVNVGKAIWTWMAQAANSRTTAVGKMRTAATIEIQKRAPARSSLSASDPIQPASNGNISGLQRVAAGPRKPKWRDRVPQYSRTPATSMC